MPLREERNEVTRKLIDLYAYNRVTRGFAQLPYFFAFISPISSILQDIMKGGLRFTSASSMRMLSPPTKIQSAVRDFEIFRLFRVYMYS